MFLACSYFFAKSQLHVLINKVLIKRKTCNSWVNVILKSKLFDSKITLSHEKILKLSHRNYLKLSHQWKPSLRGQKIELEVIFYVDEKLIESLRTENVNVTKCTNQKSVNSRQTRFWFSPVAYGSSDWWI